MGVILSSSQPALLGRKPTGRIKLNKFHPLAPIFITMVCPIEGAGSVRELIGDYPVTHDSGSVWGYGEGGVALKMTDSVASAVKYIIPDKPLMKDFPNHRIGVVIDVEYPNMDASDTHYFWRINKNDFYMGHRDWSNNCEFNVRSTRALNVDFGGYGRKRIVSLIDIDGTGANYIASIWINGVKTVGTSIEMNVFTEIGDDVEIGDSLTKGQQSAAWTYFFAAFIAPPGTPDQAFLEMSINLYAPFGIPLVLDESIPEFPMLVAPGGGGGATVPKFLYHQRHHNKAA